MTDAMPDPEQRLQDCAIAIDEALLTGRDPESVRIPELSASERAELADLVGCLSRLQNHFHPRPDGIDDAFLAPSIPGFEILGELGEGGMGSVYLARQTKLKRVVALKVLRSGGGVRPEDRARLRQEAEAAARLQHPNIIEIYEVGECGPLPYFAMEYVNGGSLAEVVSARTFAADDAARICQVVAVAVHHAHTRGVVHRDLKPSNILLRWSPASASPGSHSLSVDASRIKLTDFGLAKYLDTDGSLTRTGAAVGTPSYMAPEQALGLKETIGIASDVYSLGAVLYELLTGRPPFRAASSLEILEQVRSREPAAIRNLQPTTPRDLETICLKCLEKAPEKRYPTALALAEDLERFLDRRPIQARPCSRLARLARWGQRNPILAALVASVLMGLCVSSSLAIAAYQAAARADDRAAAESRARAETEYALYLNRILLADFEWQNNQATAARQALEQCRPAPERSDHRDWEWRHLWLKAHPEIATIDTRLGPVSCLAVAPDGTRIAVGSRDGRVAVLESDGKPTFSVTLGPVVRALAFDASGKVLAVGGVERAERNLLKVIDPSTGVTLQDFSGKQSRTNGLAFSPDGRLAAVSTHDTLVVDVENGETLARVPIGGDAIAWGSNHVLAIGGAKPAQPGSYTGIATLWDLREHRVLRSWECQGAGVHCLDFDKRTRQLATAGEDGGLSLWKTDSFQAVFSIFAHTRRVVVVQISPDGRSVATAGEDDVIHLWDMRNGRRLRSYRGHAGHPACLAFARDGKRLYSAGRDGTVRVWNAREDAGVQVQELEQDVGHFELTSDAVVRVKERWNGETFQRSEIVLQDRSSGRVSWEVSLDQPLARLALLPRAKQLLAVDAQDQLHIWRTDSGEKDPHTIPGCTAACAWSSDEKLLATTGLNGVVRLFDTGSWTSLGAFVGIHHVHAVAVSPDHRYVAAAGFRKKEGQLSNWLVVWNVKDREPIHQVSGTRIHALAFSNDSRLLVTAGDETRGLAIDSGATTFILAHSQSPFRHVAFSPNGQRIAVAGTAAVKLLDLRGNDILTLPFDLGRCERLFFDAARDQLVGYGEFGATIWSAKSE